MTWVLITGAGTTTATKFFGDVMNKVNNMFEGVDVSDSVVINAAVQWTMGNMTMTGRFQTDKGSDVASPAGGIMTLGTDGNVFDVTGTNTINEILGTTWTLGAQIVLQFDGILTVTHVSGGTNDIILGNAANMTTAAGNTLSLYFDGTDWVETSRNVGDGAGDALTSGTLGQFAATTSAQLAGVISNETGTGLLVFATDPVFTTPDLGVPSALTLTNAGGYVGDSSLTTLGTITAGVWTGTAIASANLDSDTAHLTTTQTFSGAKTFTLIGTFDAGSDMKGFNVDNIQNLIHDLSTATTALDFANDELQEISISASTTFTGTGYAIGKTKVIKITTDGTLRTLAFPSGWVFIGAKPTDQAASKTGILSITSFTTAEAGVVASYAVQE